MINKLLSSIEKNASWKKVIILFFVIIFFAICIITMFFGLIKLNPDAIMDGVDYYNSNTFFQYLEQQGSEGRQSYLILHLFDYLYIILSTLFLIFTIYLLLQKVTHSKDIKYLSLVPIASAIFDILENLCIDISILFFPKKITILANLSGYFTVIKMMVLYISFTIVLVSIMIVIIKTIKNKLIKN